MIIIITVVYIFIPLLQTASLDTTMITVQNRSWFYFKVARENNSKKMKMDQLAALSENVKSLQAVLPLISGKWKLSILVAIGDGIYKFRDLQRSLVPITTRSLSNELKELEAQKLIVRHVDDSASTVAVNYNLSPLGDSLLAVVNMLINWGNQHSSEIS